MLTGATAVVILLTIATVAMVAGAWSGWSAMRRARVMGVRTASLAVTGDDLAYKTVVPGIGTLLNKTRIDGYTAGAYLGFGF